MDLTHLTKEQQSILQKDLLIAHSFNNSIAMCGADVDVGNWGVSNPVWIFDNEPRTEKLPEGSAVSLTKEKR